MDPVTVGIVGAGVIGAGVAQALAETSHRVVLVDLSDSILARCRDSIAQTLRLQKLLRQRPAPPAAQVLNSIVCTTDLTRLGGASVIVIL